MPAVIIAATLLAVGLRLYDLSRPGYLFGISEYDDGTDFGSAIRLVHGAVPYRDFIMVQPPGITLIMFPIALITKGMGTITGMAVARVFTALASAAAVPVAGLLVRHRGLFATLVACGVLAIYPDSVLAAQLRFWGRELDGVRDELALPFDRSRPVEPSHRCETVRFTVDRDLHGRLDRERQDLSGGRALLPGEIGGVVRLDVGRASGVAVEPERHARRLPRRPLAASRRRVVRRQRHPTPPPPSHR